jgi:alpha-amylase
MDYEVFGVRHLESSGIFDFMRVFPEYVLARPGMKFATLSEAARQLTPAAKLDVPQFMSWADAERDLTAWKGNEMQCDALEALYRLESRVKGNAGGDLLMVWRRLQSSDHFYYMCTKWFSNGDANRYFNPYGSPYDAYINFMNVLGDFELTLEQDALVSPGSVASAAGSTVAASGARTTKSAKAPAKKNGSAVTRGKAEKKPAPAGAASEKAPVSKTETRKRTGAKPRAGANVSPAKDVKR